MSSRCAWSGTLALLLIACAAKEAPRPDELPAGLRLQTAGYKELVNRGSYAQGIEEIRKVLPELERFVAENPMNADGHLELSAAYSTPMIVAATKLPPGPDVMNTILEGVRNDHIGKARRELAAFERYARPNDPRLKAAAQLRTYLEEVETKAKGGG
ncbi:MAG: hypothetical protein ACXW5U_17245 [Thermoanaerobaculia bacterium]